MEEFYYAGGLPAVLRRLGEAGLLPHPDALTVNGKSLWDNVRDAPIYNDEVIRPLDKPLIADGGICILRGNLAPRGAVLKPSAASPQLLQAPRPRGGVRELRPLQGAHRRSGPGRRRRTRCW